MVSLLRIPHSHIHCSITIIYNSSLRGLQAEMAETAASLPPISRLEYGRDPEGKELLVMRTLQSHERGKKHAGMERSGEPRDVDGIVPAPEALQPYQGTNTIVMMEWEKEYMEKLVEALNVQADDEVRSFQVVKYWKGGQRATVRGLLFIRCVWRWK